MSLINLNVKTLVPEHGYQTMFKDFGIVLKKCYDAIVK